MINCIFKLQVHIHILFIIIIHSSKLRYKLVYTYVYLSIFKFMQWSILTKNFTYLPVYILSIDMLLLIMCRILSHAHAIPNSMVSLT